MLLDSFSEGLGFSDTFCNSSLMLNPAEGGGKIFDVSHGNNLKLVADLNALKAKLFHAGLSSVVVSFAVPAEPASIVDRT